MADLKPSTAPSASTLDGTELIPCTQGGASKALTPAQIRTLIETLLSILTVDNIQINGSTIASVNANGDINLDPNGTGNVTVVSGNLQVPASAAFNNPSLRIGETNTGIANDGGVLRAVITGTERVRMRDDRVEFLGGAKSLAPWAAKADSGEAAIGPNASDLNTGLGTTGDDQLALVAGGLVAARAIFATNGYFLVRAHDGAIADGSVPTSFCAVYLNEAGNTLTFKVKYADGTTVKTGTVALT